MRASFLPRRSRTARRLTALAKAIAAAAKVMGLDLSPEPYSEPVMELDPEVVRFLAMMDAASKDYGSPFPVPLDQVKGDRELTVLTAHLLGLAKDRDFKDFLNMPLEEEGMETEVEVKVKPGMEEEEEEDFDFAGRMRR